VQWPGRGRVPRDPPREIQTAQGIRGCGDELGDCGCLTGLRGGEGGQHQPGHQRLGLAAQRNLSGQRGCDLGPVRLGQVEHKQPLKRGVIPGRPGE
jgi:hypothetical protein